MFRFVALIGLAIALSACSEKTIPVDYGFAPNKETDALLVVYQPNSSIQAIRAVDLDAKMFVGEGLFLDNQGYPSSDPILQVPEPENKTLATISIPEGQAYTTGAIKDRFYLREVSEKYYARTGVNYPHLKGSRYICLSTGAPVHEITAGAINLIILDYVYNLAEPFNGKGIQDLSRSETEEFFQLLHKAKEDDTVHNLFLPAESNQEILNRLKAAIAKYPDLASRDIVLAPIVQKIDFDGKGNSFWEFGCPNKKTTDFSISESR